jgi:hypothetical protein
MTSRFNHVKSTAMLYLLVVLKSGTYVFHTTPFNPSVSTSPQMVYDITSTEIICANTSLLVIFCIWGCLGVNVQRGGSVIVYWA